MQSEKALLSEKQVAAEYGLGQAWLRRCRLMRTGPPYVRLGSRMVRYRRRDLENYLDGCRVETGRLNGSHL